MKDLIAYLRLAATLSDEVALARIINTPARAIGARTVEKLQAWADAAGRSLCTALFGTCAVRGAALASVLWPDRAAHAQTG